MKVIISNRSVYHKYAEVEVEIPAIIVRRNQVQEWLIENEHLYQDKIDEAMDKADYEFGFGLDYTGMNEKDSESEWRYDCAEALIGGHL